MVASGVTPVFWSDMEAACAANSVCAGQKAQMGLLKWGKITGLLEQLVRHGARGASRCADAHIRARAPAGDPGADVGGVSPVPVQTWEG
jgi:hypothetical protein